MKANYLYLFVLILATVVSCQKKSEEKSAEQVLEEAKFDEQTEALNARFDEVLGFADISETTAMLEATGADYNPNFINDPGRGADYANGTDEKAAINLGVYYTDLHYTAAYQKGDQSAAVLESANRLAEKIGLGRVLEQAVEAEFKERIENDPEAQGYVNDLFKNSSKKLNTEDRSRMSTLVIAGAFVERLYILGSILDNYEEELTDEQKSTILFPVARALYRQEARIDKLIELSLLVRKPTDPSDFFKGLDAIAEAYDKVDETIRADALDPSKPIDLSILDPVIDVVYANRAAYVE